ncbi:MAG: serine hydroxymethyltransferase, partial [Parcubacteria group bacterium]
MKDKEIGKFIEEENKRQKGVINLIASENYVSQDVLKALGSGLTNKYGEGYPGRRYYRGTSVVDKVEIAAQKRALKLFGLKEDNWGVNVQPLSGSPANFAVYASLIPIGGKIMGMALSHGGHLTHGQKVSMTGKFWNAVLYEVDKKTELIDYGKLKKMAVAEKPDIIVAGFTAYAHIVD